MAIERNEIVRRTNITDLPESLIHRYIASRLCFQDVGRMSVSSKSWRYLCYTSPRMNFDIHRFGAVCNSNNQRENLTHYLNYIHRLLLCARNLQLKSFALTSTQNFADETLIQILISTALQCNPQELYLNLRILHCSLPDATFTLPSLKILTLDMKLKSIKLPRGMTNLHTLSLKAVTLQEDSLGTWISTQSPCLKTFNLEDCVGFSTLKLMSQTLETLNIRDRGYYYELQSIDIHCDNLLRCSIHVPRDVRNSFQIFAPKLQSFTFSGQTKKCSILSPFRSIDFANIHVLSTDGYRENNVSEVRHKGRMHLRFCPMESATIKKDFFCSLKRINLIIIDMPTNFKLVDTLLDNGTELDSLCIMCLDSDVTKKCHQHLMQTAASSVRSGKVLLV